MGSLENGTSILGCYLAILIHVERESIPIKSSRRYHHLAAVTARLYWWITDYGKHEY